MARDAPHRHAMRSWPKTLGSRLYESLLRTFGIKDMDRIRIRGGRPITGEIAISGAKNAALPLMAACLLTDQTLRLSNLPHLVDTQSYHP